MAPHSSTLAWKIPWTEEPGTLHAVHGVAKSRARLSDCTFTFHFHAEGNGNPLQGSCLENPRDRGAWWAAVYGVAQSWTRLKRLSSSSSLHLYMTTGKTIALTRRTFVSKVMSLLFNMLSRLVIVLDASKGQASSNFMAAY